MTIDFVCGDNTAHSYAHAVSAEKRQYAGMTSPHFALATERNTCLRRERRRDCKGQELSKTAYTQRSKVDATGDGVANKKSEPGEEGCTSKLLQKKRVPQSPNKVCTR